MSVSPVTQEHDPRGRCQDSGGKEAVKEEMGTWREIRTGRKERYREILFLFLPRISRTPN